MQNRKEANHLDERRCKLKSATIVVGCTAMAAIVLIVALTVRVKIEGRSELVGADEPVLGLILQGRPIEDIKRELEKKPHLAVDYVWQGGTLLCYAAGAGRNDVAELLLNMGADPDGSPGMFSPIMDAISSRDPDIVRALLDHGASVLSPQPPFGFTPCEIGLECGNEDIAALMGEARDQEKGERNEHEMSRAQLNKPTGGTGENGDGGT